MTSLRFHIRFPENKIKEPIIYQIGHEFKVVTNVRRADVRETTGWMDLELTGETAFNAAERAFAEASAAEGERARAKYAEAVSGYQTTLGSTNKPWLKDWAMPPASHRHASTSGRSTSSAET